MPVPGKLPINVHKIIGLLSTKAKLGATLGTLLITLRITINLHQYAFECIIIVDWHHKTTGFVDSFA